MTLTTGRSASLRGRGVPPVPAVGDARTGRAARTTVRRAGFTLLELVMVLMLISLVMGLAAPSLRGFLSGRKSAEAAAQIIALGQYARTQAVSTGATYRLNVDPMERLYWLTVQRAGGDFRDLGTEVGRRFSLPERVEASWMLSSHAAHDYIEFYADGRTEAGSLQLTDGDGQVFDIGCRSETEPLVVMQRSGR